MEDRPTELSCVSTLVLVQVCTRHSAQICACSTDVVTGMRVCVCVFECCDYLIEQSLQAVQELAVVTSSDMYTTTSALITNTYPLSLSLSLSPLPLPSSPHLVLMPLCVRLLMTTLPGSILGAT